MNEQEEIAQMVRLFTQSAVEAIETIKSPLNDWLRSISAAQVDGFIDAREQFINHGWPPELADAAILGLIQRNIDFGKQMSQAIEKAQQRYQSQK